MKMEVTKIIPIKELALVILFFELILEKKTENGMRNSEIDEIRPKNPNRITFVIISL